MVSSSVLNCNASQVPGKTGLLVSTSAKDKMKTITDKETDGPWTGSHSRIWPSCPGLTQGTQTEKRLMKKPDATLFIVARVETLPGHRVLSQTPNLSWCVFRAARICGGISHTCRRAGASGGSYNRVFFSLGSFWMLRILYYWPFLWVCSCLFFGQCSTCSIFTYGYFHSPGSDLASSHLALGLTPSKSNNLQIWESPTVPPLHGHMHTDSFEHQDSWRPLISKYWS